jgi:hypothetical protein
MHDTMRKECNASGLSKQRLKEGQIHHSGVEVGLAWPIRLTVPQKEDQQSYKVQLGRYRILHGEGNSKSRASTKGLPRRPVEYYAPDS